MSKNTVISTILKGKLTADTAELFTAIDFDYSKFLKQLRILFLVLVTLNFLHLGVGLLIAFKKVAVRFGETVTQHNHFKINFHSRIRGVL